MVVYIGTTVENYLTCLVEEDYLHLYIKNKEPRFFYSECMTTPDFWLASGYAKKLSLELRHVPLILEGFSQKVALCDILPIGEPFIVTRCYYMQGLDWKLRRNWGSMSPCDFGKGYSNMYEF
jgi:hypothetical protein